MDKFKIAWLAPYPIQYITQAFFARKISNDGTGTWLYNLARELIKYQNIELHIIIETGNIRYSQKIYQDGICFHLIKNSIPFSHRGFPAFFPFQELCGYYFNSLRIKKVIDSIVPDVIHAHGTENSYAISAIKSKYPYVISIQGVLHEIVKYESSLRFKLKKNLEAKAVKSGSNFICRTNLDEALVKSLNADANVYNIYEAMNPIYFKINWKVDDNFNILFVGSIQERKGIMILLKAIKEVKKQIQDIKLYVIGKGNINYLNIIDSYCKDNDLLNNVTFCGYQPSTEIAKFHLKSQILICPSFIENSPNSVAEAMVTGLPIIASRTGGIPSMIKQAETGYLFENGNITELTERIIYLLRNPKERQRISSNSKTIARERHSPASVALTTLNLYKKILNDYQ